MAAANRRPHGEGAGARPGRPDPAECPHWRVEMTHEGGRGYAMVCRDCGMGSPARVPTAKMAADDFDHQVNELRKIRAREAARDRRWS